MRSLNLRPGDLINAAGALFLVVSRCDISVPHRIDEQMCSLTLFLLALPIDERKNPNEQRVITTRRGAFTIYATSYSCFDVIEECE